MIALRLIIVLAAALLIALGIVDFAADGPENVSSSRTATARR